MQDKKMQESFYLVRKDVLPEALYKTIQAKELIAKGEARTIHEAVDRVDLSRSAFYKYKDGIFPLNRLDRERIITISMELEHRSGILSRVLALIAEIHGNVLTMSQTIPLQGMAHVVISVEISSISAGEGKLLEALSALPGVQRASIVAQG